MGRRRDLDAHNNANEVTGGLIVFACANQGTLKRALVTARYESVASCLRLLGCRRLIDLGLFRRIAGVIYRLAPNVLRFK
ncbi:MAG TPA: hypothetical protein VGP63_03255 [Planctomycetaceae bacterium]|nr:hypothetical protein [Planctomycetaceae bacterium]